MTDAPAPTEPAPPMPEDVAIFARFAPSEADVVGLLAYALHRQAELAFRADFFRLHARTPGPAEAGAFLIGELSEARVAAYRARARMLLTPVSEAGPALAPPPAKRKPRWPFFGFWVDAPLAPSGEPGPINWRGLLWRFAILLAAVVMTAVLLRVLVVKA
jgi:hypothetical protein